MLGLRRSIPIFASILSMSTALADAPPASSPFAPQDGATYLKLAKNLDAFLQRRPKDPGFFIHGKNVIDHCDSIVRATVQPYSVCALCLEADAIDHLARFESYLAKAEVKRFLKVVGDATGYRAACNYGAKSRGFNVAATCYPTRTPAPTPPFPTIPGCRPADLVFSSRAPAARDRCAVYVTAELRRLLATAKRKFTRKEFQAAHTLVERAFAIAPQWTEVRRARAFTKAAIRDMSAALREVAWWRETFGSESAEELLDDLQRVAKLQ